MCVCVCVCVCVYILTALVLFFFFLMKQFPSFFFLASLKKCLKCGHPQKKKNMKKKRVLKALMLVALVMVVSPKWRLCVSANAEEEGESNAGNDNTNTNTKDDGERRGIFGELFSWFSEGQKQTLTPSFVGKCRERCKGLNVSSGPMCDTKNNATYANECWFRCKHDYLEESSGDVQSLSVLEEGACAFFLRPEEASVRVQSVFRSEGFNGVSAGVWRDWGNFCE